MTRLGRRLLDLRAVDRLTMTDRFDRALEVATDSDINDLDKLNTPSEWRDWISKRLKETLADRSFNELRNLARKNGVVRYSRMNRDELLEALRAIGMV